MIPGRLKKWQIDQSLCHAAEEGPKISVVSAPVNRTRLDPGNTTITSSFLLLVQILNRSLPMALKN